MQAHKEHELIGIIAAVGRGSRVWPLTSLLPKCLVPVGGVPMIVHQCSWMRRLGIREMHAIVPQHQLELAAPILQSLGISAHAGLDWRTFWTVSNNAAQGRSALIVNCDILLQGWTRLTAEHLESNADLTIACSNRIPLDIGQSGKSAHGTLRDRRVVSLKASPAPGTVEMRQIGVSIMGPRCWTRFHEFPFRAADPFQEEILPRMVADHSVHAAFSSDSWRDVGTFEGLFHAHWDFASPSHDRQSVICGGSTVSPNAVVTSSVIMAGAHVPAHVHLERCLVLPNVSVEPNTVARDEVLGSAFRGHLARPA